MVLAIDGGGTKAEAVLVDEGGQVFSRARGQGCNPSLLDDAALEAHLRHLILPMLQSGFRPDAAFLGGAGCASAESENRMRGILSGLLGEMPITVRSDGLNVLYSGTHGGAGVGIISGTGSLVVAMSPEGIELHAGGWGYLLGDEGSGFDLGRRAMALCLEKMDRGLSAGALGRAICRHFEANSLGECIAPLYRAGRGALPQLAPTVLDCAQAGDELALQALEQSFGALAQQALGLIRRMEAGRLPMVLGGGVWKHPLARAVFARQLPREMRGMLILPRCAPVYGAAIQAVDLTGAVRRRNFFENFLKSERAIHG